MANTNQSKTTEQLSLVKTVLDHIYESRKQINSLEEKAYEYLHDLLENKGKVAFRFNEDKYPLKDVPDDKRSIPPPSWAAASSMSSSTASAVPKTVPSSPCMSRVDRSWLTVSSLNRRPTERNASSVSTSRISVTPRTSFPSLSTTSKKTNSPSVLCLH